MAHDCAKTMPETLGTRLLDAPDGVVSATAALIASGGIRGATLREIAAEAGLPLGTLFKTHGNKEALLAAAFAHGAAADGVAFQSTLHACEGLAADAAMRGEMLWALCEPVTTEGRERAMLLAELLLQAPQHPYLGQTAQDWIVSRRDVVRGLFPASSHGTASADILLMIHLAESMMAPACGGSPGWRLVGRLGFMEAGALLGEWPLQNDPDAIARVSENFHSDPEPAGLQGDGAAPVRSQIVAAAGTILVEAGIAAVTNRAVAERAGCSLAATTYHFQTISDLVLAAVLHIFAQSRQAPKGGRLAISPDGASRWIEGRNAPTAGERAGTSALVEIALAAARGQIPQPLGLTVRRQRGTITHARLQAHGHAISRGRTASAANWFTGVYLVSAALPEAEQLFDFEAQAQLVGKQIFGFPH